MGMNGVPAIFAFRRVAIAACLASLCGGPANAQSPDTKIVEPDGQTETVSLFVGRSTIIRAPWPVKTVSVTDPAIANVEVLTDRQVLVMAKSAGSTDMILLNEDGQDIWQARIDVDIDVHRIQADLSRLFADCTLDVTQSEDVVIITGTLAHAEQVERLHKFLNIYKIKFVDMTKLAGLQQVQVKIRIAEASRSALRMLGINALAAGTNDNVFFGASLISGSGGPLVPISIGPPSGAVAGAENVPFTFNADVSVTPLVTLLAGFPRADLEFFLSALTENSYLRILAEPTLVALSGQEASFLAGGEFPIPIVQGIGGGSAISIQYKQFGVQLSFRPTVLGDNTISLTVAPEVSALSDTGAIQIQGFRVPALVTRKSSTTLVLRSGQTFAMAGLLQQTNEGRTTSIPGLGDLPVLGALFRSVRYQKSETELLVLVTATLVEPLSVDGDLPVPGSLHVPPNDWELYAEGRIEGRTPEVISTEYAEWLKELGLGRLRGPGTWTTYDSAAVGSRATLPRWPASSSTEGDSQTEGSAPRPLGEAQGHQDEE